MKVQVYCEVEAGENDAYMKKAVEVQRVPRIGESFDGYLITDIRHRSRGTGSRTIVLTETASAFEGPDDGAPIVKRLKKRGYRRCSEEEYLEAAFE